MARQMIHSCLGSQFGRDQARNSELEAKLYGPILSTFE